MIMERDLRETQDSIPTNGIVLSPEANNFHSSLESDDSQYGYPTDESYGDCLAPELGHGDGANHQMDYEDEQHYAYEAHHVYEPYRDTGNIPDQRDIFPDPLAEDDDESPLEESLVLCTRDGCSRNPHPIRTKDPCQSMTTDDAVQRFSQKCEVLRKQREENDKTWEGAQRKRYGLNQHMSASSPLRRGLTHNPGLNTPSTAFSVRPIQNAPNTNLARESVNKAAAETYLTLTPLPPTIPQGTRWADMDDDDDEDNVDNVPADTRSLETLSSSSEPYSEDEFEEPNAGYEADDEADKQAVDKSYGSDSTSVNTPICSMNGPGNVQEESCGSTLPLANESLQHEASTSQANNFRERAQAQTPNTMDTPASGVSGSYVHPGGGESAEFHQRSQHKAKEFINPPQPPHSSTSSAFSEEKSPKSLDNEQLKKIIEQLRLVLEKFLSKNFKANSIMTAEANLELERHQQKRVLMDAHQRLEALNNERLTFLKDVYGVESFEAAQPVLDAQMDRLEYLESEEKSAKEARKKNEIAQSDARRLERKVQDLEASQGSLERQVPSANPTHPKLAPSREEKSDASKRLPKLGDFNVSVEAFWATCTKAQGQERLDELIGRVQTPLDQLRGMFEENVLFHARIKEHLVEQRQALTKLKQDSEELMRSDVGDDRNGPDEDEATTSTTTED